MTTGAPKRIRILHVMTRYQQGGSERNVAHTIDWEQRAGHDVHLAVGSVHAPRERSPAFRFTWSLGSSDRSDRTSTFWRRARPARARQVGAFPRRSYPPIQGWRPGSTRRSRRRSTRRPHRPYVGVRPRLRACGIAVHRLAERYCARRTDRIVAVGVELMDRYVAAGVGVRQQYSVIRSPIDLVEYLSVRRRGSDEIRSLRDSIGVSPTRPLVAAIGALESRKRIDLILREFVRSLRVGAWSLAIGEMAQSVRHSSASAHCSALRTRSDGSDMWKNLLDSSRQPTSLSMPGALKASRRSSSKLSQPDGQWSPPSRLGSGRSNMPASLSFPGPVRASGRP